MAKKNHNAIKSHHHHPSHTGIMPRLKRAKGQIDAVERMIERNDYCPNIIQQLRAATSALRALEIVILESHLEHCVKDAMTSQNQKDSKKKISELINLFKKRY